jgi:hypothetical protein
LTINIIAYELSTNPPFVTWFNECPTLSSAFTLFSAVDARVLNILSSDLFGLKIFSAPLTQRSRKIMFYGSILNIFIEDVPQLMIQILYNQRVVTFDLVPTFAIISGGLVIVNKLILSLYHLIIRWQHQRRSNFGNFNVEQDNNNAEEEIELDIIKMYIE